MGIVVITDGGFQAGVLLFCAVCRRELWIGGIGRIHGSCCPV